MIYFLCCLRPCWCLLVFFNYFFSLLYQERDNFVIVNCYDSISSSRPRNWDRKYSDTLTFRNLSWKQSRWTFYMSGKRGKHWSEPRHKQMSNYFVAVVYFCQSKHIKKVHRDLAGQIQPDAVLQTTTNEENAFSKQWWWISAGLPLCFHHTTQAMCREGKKTCIILMVLTSQTVNSPRRPQFQRKNPMNFLKRRGIHCFVLLV